MVKFGKGKSGTNFIEDRYFDTRGGAIHVKLSVHDDPNKERTLNHLLAHLRLHYGKYEGVCQQVEEAVFATRNGAKAND